MNIVNIANLSSYLVIILHLVLVDSIRSRFLLLFICIISSNLQTNVFWLRRWHLLHLFLGNAKRETNGTASSLMTQRVYMWSYEIGCSCAPYVFDVYTKNKPFLRQRINILIKWNNIFMALEWWCAPKKTKWKFKFYEFNVDLCGT